MILRAERQFDNTLCLCASSHLEAQLQPFLEGRGQDQASDTREPLAEPTCRVAEILKDPEFSLEVELNFEVPNEYQVVRWHGGKEASKCGGADDHEGVSSINVSSHDIEYLPGRKKQGEVVLCRTRGSIVAWARELSLRTYVTTASVVL